MESTRAFDIIINGLMDLNEDFSLNDLRRSGTSWIDSFLLMPSHKYWERDDPFYSDMRFFIALAKASSVWSSSPVFTLQVVAAPNYY